MTSPLPNEIVRALRDFVKAAVTAMRATGRDPFTVLSPWVRQWRRSGDPAFFIPGPVPKLELPLRLAGTNGPLQLIPEYAQVRELFLHDSWLANFVDALVGTASHRTRVDFDMLLDEKLLIPFVAQVGELRFDERAFERVLDQLAAELMRRDLPSLSLVPFSGLTCDSPLELGGGLVVRRLEESELSDLLDLGVLPDRSDRFGRYIAESDQTALCLAERVPLAFGDLPDTVLSHRNLNTPADDFCMAVRLTVGGALERGPYINLHHDLFGMSTGAWYEQRRPRMVGGITAVIHDRNEEASVIQLYDRLRAVSGAMPTRLTIARQRFRDARLRPDPIDVLLDLVIAAEALLVGGEGATTMRLALGAAVWCEFPGIPRSAVRRFVTHAYKARSKLVHGRTMSARDLRNLGGDRCELPSVIDDVERVVSAGLIRAIEAGTAFDGSRTWETLLDEQLDEAL